MYLKLLALLTTIIFFILIILGFKFNIPIAYIPENSNQFEFIILHAIFMVVETFIILGLFLHMLQTADIELDSQNLKELFYIKK